MKKVPLLVNKNVAQKSVFLVENNDKKIKNKLSFLSTNSFL